MGCCRLALSVFVLGLLLALSSAPVRANGAMAMVAADVAPCETRGVIPAGILHHSKKARSYYCYPQVYWLSLIHI